MPSLTERHAEILRTYRETGYNAAETARRLDIQRGTVTKTLQRIKEKGVDVRSGGSSVTNGQGVRADDAHRTSDAQWTEPEINGAIRLLLRQGGNPDGPEQINAVRDQIAANGLPLDCLAEVEKVKLYQQAQKGEDGQASTVNLVSTHLRPGSQAPSWPVVQPGPPVKIEPAKVRPRARTGWARAMVLPDIQIGYWRAPDDSLIPMHDEAAIDVCRQVIREVQPETIVLVGDNLDFPELGKYTQTPGFARTTQAAIDRRTTLAAQLRADAGPEAEIVEIEGNHEKRLASYLLSNAMAAFGLRRGAEPPESWPVMSVPFLCRYEESSVRYVPGYPAAEYWLNEGLRFVHGSKVRSGGSTAHAYLKDARHSTAFGHVHRIERAHITRHTRSGPRTVGAYCFGCLCRIDGRVPSAKAGFDYDGMPVGETEDWQQGFGLVEYKVGGVAHSVEQFEIWNGWTRFRGQEYAAGCTVDGEKVA